MSTNLPASKGMRIRQLHDVSSRRPNNGDLYIFTEETGKWEPQPGNFDDRYAPLDDYAPLVHDHDEAYAPLGHNHDATYAPLSHTHDDRYFTETESDARFAPIGHNHSGVYAPVSHSHSNASTSASGFMSSGDKTKLNGIATGATANSPSNATPQNIFNVNQQSGDEGSSSLYSRADHQHPQPGLAQTSRDGWMSMFDKTKLNGIATGATATPLSNTAPTFLRIEFGGSSAGTSNEAARRDHVHSSPGLASPIQDGWMSKEDKIKLNSL